MVIRMKPESYVVSDIELALSVPLTTMISKKLSMGALKYLFKNRCGFTLAETLITMTVLGVIAALTIPTFMNFTQKHTFVAGLKKAYSNFSNAVKMIPMSENCSAGDYECAGWTAYYTDSENILMGGEPATANLRILEKQFKSLKFVMKEEDDFCADFVGMYGTACFYTEDGMVYGSSTAYSFVVDVNGTKPPNERGRDRFDLRVAWQNRNGFHVGDILPLGSRQYHKYIGPNADGPHWSQDDSKCKKSNVTYYCTGRVLEENKMNY